MSAWLYGQAPSRSRPKGDAFEGAPNGTFLAELAGTSEAELRQLVRMRNLLHCYPGPAAGKGDLFPRAEAQAAATRESGWWREGDRVVFAGRAVAAAFGFREREWLRWRWVRSRGGTGVWAAVFPHPSRVNQYWNDEARCRAAAWFLRALVARARLVLEDRR